MALSRLSLAFSLLVLSFLAIASAGDYGDSSSKYGFDGIPADSPQAKPEGEDKPTFYGTNQDSYKPKPEEKETADYSKSPYVVKPNPEGEEKPTFYGTNQHTYKGREEYGYGKGDEKPSYGTKPEEVKNHLSIAVQGTVLCKTGSNYHPIQGALATITCKAVDEVGVEKTISICSKPTDAEGYFFAPLSDLGRDKLKLRECKAYLKSSPLATCNVPANVNKAVEGALLSAFRVLNEKKTKLYSVGPFFYTSQAQPQPQPAPKYGY
ncbi:hypothetical protein HRI_003774400 [Hibiscus trionum]|uniref:Uncharacterized protein n=1 Tax=Hibiscus trionum TaxID=183268 RepID=A0A9W7IT29_HIBTR|nr:hypothetical protein HRI_003773900 [Hibiscus trionum]GMJ01048.1 hypothetical protein HRI_003774000 [Hibiscus trionum]GMJ01049.1 hypothetical protein HRI_003774100 [Hibiscus trionum]GMJ01050.1 hypothetical protein HRI_003774200 [Hibiscus trionum]GMJ01051.1 hypothetical protein HRI_003774300 [Hibiscus trionum]